jgi:hypothetical protein
MSAPSDTSLDTSAGAPDAPVRRRRLQGAGADVLVVLGTFVVLGVLGGVLWWVLAPTPEYTKIRGGGAMDEVDLGRQFGAVAWYVAIAVVAGLLFAIALTWWRDRDPLLLAGLLLLGSVVAAVLMALVGHALGPADPQPLLATAELGAKVPDQLHVGARAAYLAWPISVLLGCLVILWGRLPAEPSAGRREEEAEGSRTGEHL